MKLTDIKRQTILDAAEELFYELGVDATSMDHLAIKAEVSKRTIYNHFSNKEALFQAIITRMLEGLTQDDDVLYCHEQPLFDQLCQIANNEVNLLSSEPFLRVAKITFMQLLKEPQLAQSINGHRFGCLTYLERFLTEACHDGVLKIDDIEFSSKQFVYQLKSFIFYPLLYGFEKKETLKDRFIVEETVRLFLARYQNRAS
ncbi:TetR/AcrR family transcriptional regulator [Marinomonas sp.]|nr:TetR/AcrR family transcriptional regulator [Marinomonas sp.]MDB4837034.1 TetR/AcrR family transcriptional regulator [Marinomonas sp.]